MPLASFASWVASRLRGHKIINLTGEERPGGYVFVRSPQLPGFSMMLAPGQHEEVGDFISAVGGPLRTFIAAELHADNQKKFAITGATKTDSTTYLAELCAA